jgi:hypothetical protein
VKHFSEEAWADFARNLVAPGIRATMQRHIDTGCQKCGTSLLLWQAVAAVGNQESAYAPSEDIVRVAKAQYSAVAAHFKTSLLARLVFDSNLQPVTVGLRGTAATRQFLYEAGDYVIDLRLDAKREMDRISLVGQVLNRAKTSGAAQGVLVRLLKGVLPVANTATNDFGEFQLEFDAGTDFSIAIGMDEENVIVLPLHGVHNRPLPGKHLE